MDTTGNDDATDRTVFEVDDATDPDGTFPQSIASGGPTPTGVILWTRLAPDAFDHDEPLGVRESSCMLDGADRCEILVTRTDGG